MFQTSNQDCICFKLSNYAWETRGHSLTFTNGRSSVSDALPEMVNIEKAIENGHRNYRNSGFTHEKW